PNSPSYTLYLHDALPISSHHSILSLRRSVRKGPPSASAAGSDVKGSITRSPDLHSSRSATIGSTRIARIAGTYPAARATPSKTTGTHAKTIGSKAEIP